MKNNYLKSLDIVLREYSKYILLVLHKIFIQENLVNLDKKTKSLWHLSHHLIPSPPNSVTEALVQEHRALTPLGS